MEAQLNELIAKIKSEGVQAADEQASKIIAEAEQRAEQIIDEARLKARSMVEEAKAERAKTEAAGTEALKQAGRDLLLSIQEKITQIFSTVIEKRVSAALDEKTVKDAVVTVIGGWKDEEARPDVLLGEELAGRLESQLRGALADEFAAGVEIKPVSGVAAGFRVATKDGSAYYDFTATTIAESLAAYLGPRLQAAIQDAVE